MTAPKKTSRGRLIDSLIFYAGIAAIAVIVGLITHYVNQGGVVLENLPGKDALGKAFDAYAAVGNLLTTLGTGLLAALALFLTGAPKHRYSTRQLWPAILSALCVCLSIYFGYISGQNAAWAIEWSATTLDTPMLQWPRELQFYAIVFGVLFFADFVRRDRITAD